MLVAESFLWMLLCRVILQGAIAYHKQLTEHATAALGDYVRDVFCDENASTGFLLLWDSYRSIFQTL